MRTYNDQNSQRNPYYSPRGVCVNVAAKIPIGDDSRNCKISGCAKKESLE